MHKFIFSSKQNEFNGSFFLVYNTTGIIQEINFQDSDLATGKRSWIKKNCPEELTKEGLIDFVTSTRTECIQTTMTYSFEDFWTQYNKKINKKRCIPLWNKLTEIKKAQAVDGIGKYDLYLKVQNWRTKADPENYLKNEMWDNEWK